MESLSLAILGCLFGVVLRWTVSLNPYSGSGKPPMFGDYEAQRHWMEITFNLPVKEWYFNGTNNNLQYWGLDYPPLTAYHSWICAFIANKINPDWVKLNLSHGFESPEHKLFMRYAALVSDILIYFPAICLYFRIQNHISDRSKALAAALMLAYPGLILIDHGHFQFNSVSLGFAVWAVVAICRGYDLLGSVAFVLALNYKQMELYHAMPFFCYLLGSCFRGKELWIWKLIKLGIVVILTFAACWAPFLQSQDQAMQVLHRIFPVARGLYEDKVASFWCSISILVKLKEMYNVDTLLKICLGTTFVCLLPSSVHLLLKPSVERFKLALINSSLVFFLFSFQVHEKSILIPAVSVCLLLPSKPFESFWFLQISTFSMLPLLQKDGLILPFISLMILYHLLASMLFLEVEVRTSGKQKQDVEVIPVLIPAGFTRFLFMVSMFGCVGLTIASLTVLPPPRLPDLWPVLVSAYSSAHFLLFLIYTHWLQFTWNDQEKSTISQFNNTVISTTIRKKKQ